MSGQVTAANATFLETFGWSEADLAAGAIDWQRLGAARMAAGCLHDSNNLLMVVLGEAELALKSSAPAAMRARLRTIVDAVERAMHLTGQVAGLSRASGGIDTIDLVEVIGGARALLAALLGRGIELGMRLPRT